MATPSLLYGCKSWVTAQRDADKMQEVEMKFLWEVKFYTGLDKHRNEDIRRDVQIFYLNNGILEC
jgi:hypothetical protein